MRCGWTRQHSPHNRRERLPLDADSISSVVRALRNLTYVVTPSKSIENNQQYRLRIVVYYNLDTTIISTPTDRQQQG